LQLKWLLNVPSWLVLLFEADLLVNWYPRMRGVLGAVKCGHLLLHEVINPSIVILNAEGASPLADLYRVAGPQPSLG
jgi:hypothetical protein